MLVRLMSFILIVFAVATAGASYLMPQKARNFSTHQNLTQDEINMVEGAKSYFIQEISEFQNKLNNNYDCFSILIVCRQGLGYSAAKSSQLIRANRQFRLLVGAYKTWGNYKKGFQTHILSNRTLKALGLKKLKFTQLELRQINSLFYRNKKQILQEWKRKGLHLKSFKGYQPPRRMSAVEPLEAYHEKLYEYPGFQAYMHEKIKDLRNYYLNQIMSLVMSEPVILFIEQSAITPHVLASAYKKYILVLESRIIKIEEANSQRDLQKLALLYDSIFYQAAPSQFKDFVTPSGEVFADIKAWNTMINKINRNLNLKETNSFIINSAFFGLAGYATFMPTTALFKFSLGFSYLFKSGVDTYISLGDYHVNLMDWLSGFQSFANVKKARSQYLSSLFMSMFLAQPVLSSLTKGAQIIKLELEATDTLLQNIVSYLNAKTKMKAKTEISSAEQANSNFNQKAIFIEKSDDDIIYVSSYIADYEDFRIFESGCIDHKQAMCFAKKN